MPVQIPVLPDAFWSGISNHSFADIAFKMAKPYLEEDLTDTELSQIIENAFNFPVKLKHLDDLHDVLELFHGPTLAFKDFGARFMARLFSEKAQRDSEKITILVATSGDTGSAVAHGFYNVAGVQVCLLYPKGKVSALQEKQMTTLGKNITALEVDGVFDDCQRLVKKAFTDKDLSSKMQLSSANSINIARLLPQSFYYAYACSKINRKGISDPVFSVPSGNFGNLTGGLLAMKMGMKVKHFIAATNINDVVPKFLNGEDFKPKDSVQTISNAMDVGNPSNFSRMKYLFNGSEQQLRKHVSGYAYSDEETRRTIEQVFDENGGYLLCPHSAIGYRAAVEYQSDSMHDCNIITLSTAHPIKFRDVIEDVTHTEVQVPDRLKKWLHKKKRTIQIGKDYDEFKSFLLNK